MERECRPGVPLLPDAYQPPKGDSPFFSHQEAEWSWLLTEGRNREEESALLISSGAES